ncbi:MAG: Smr/MutS family protein [Dysgonamonadaceae bacterium]|jgi:DNA mismatch repair protein MutS2|nr:Smr/MutS family protein [Dysgonamonadaceae bacterium]
MIYPYNYEQKTGFDTIKLLVADLCLSQQGKEKAEEMSFSNNFLLIKTQLSQTDEFMTIILQEENFPADRLPDIRNALKKIQIEGAFISEKELFEIRQALNAINAVLTCLNNCNKRTPCPHLMQLAAGISQFPHQIKQIDGVIDRFGQILDQASGELALIRSQIANSTKSLSKAMAEILKKAQAESSAEKDVTPTMRDGRLVIPVLSAYKRKVRGIVHDESATGKTVFIEPQEIIEINNKIRELEGRQKREIIRILTEITDAMRPEISEIIKSYNFLAETDFIRAKATFAINTQSVMPDFENVQQLDWMSAIHPLLMISHKKQGKQVTPVDIKLDSVNRILLVSGPNAGGKSVLLKTAALLQYMLQSGMLIPVEKRSKTGIFTSLFIDIGDQQSIENDLSTYSSHLSSMKYMIENITPKTLIMIDEFGSGTEPRTGGAIAEAILQKFSDSKTFGIITTHYHNLKTFAGDSSNSVINGAMLYDTQTMQPLFKLETGYHGTSLAIEIARKTGLPDEIIKTAVEKAGHDYINLDQYLAGIMHDRQYWKQKCEQIAQHEKQLEQTKNEYNTLIQTHNQTKRKYLDDARKEAQKLLSDVNTQIEKTIRDIKESQAGKTQTQEARKTLETFRHEIHNDLSVSATQPSREEITPEVTTNISPPSQVDITVGSTVRLPGSHTTGTVINIKNNIYIIAFGAIKTKLRKDQIEPATESVTPRQSMYMEPSSSSHADYIYNKKLHFKGELDIRGMRSDDALKTLVLYIDDAIQCTVPRVRILHGKGNGTLRDVVRTYLKTVEYITNFQDEDVQFGGTGITVVEFN